MRVYLLLAREHLLRRHARRLPDPDTQRKKTKKQTKKQTKIRETKYNFVLEIKRALFPRATRSLASVALESMCVCRYLRCKLDNEALLSSEEVSFSRLNA